MVDILHALPIRAPLSRVFEAVSTPEGLDRWWTKRCEGRPVEGAQYVLWFGPAHDWRARVTRCVPRSEFELRLESADADWTGTRVGVRLEARGEVSWLHFRHEGWPSASEHYRLSCTCWAMYLRILRRYLEYGESVPYEDRLDA